MRSELGYPVESVPRQVLAPMLVLAFFAIAQCSAFAPHANGQQLDVSRHAQAQLTDNDAKRILAEASKILQTKDGPNDVPCDVTLSLAGSVSTFDLPTPTEINTPDDFKAVCQRPGYFHVVTSINDCGGLSIPGIGGCSQTPGKCILVVRLERPDPSDKEGMLWAHEYGHTKGLQHRNDENAVMNSYLGQTERQVNAPECLAFKGQTPASNNPHPGPPKPSIVEFVHRDYAEGIPFEIASSYTREDAQKLVAMLDDPEQKPYLTNIVVTLGMIGDPVAVEPLRSLVEEGDGHIDPPTLRAKTSALIALGYVVNKHAGESPALAYLAQGLNPRAWTERHLKWMPRGVEDAEQRNISLTKASAIGLGISGTPEAAMALQSAQFTIQSLDPTALPAVSPVLKHALEVNRTIQQEGLLRYHQSLQNR